MTKEITERTVAAYIGACMLFGASLGIIFILTSGTVWVFVLYVLLFVSFALATYFSPIGGSFGK